MNSINLSPNSREVESGFPTLEEMRVAHSELLERSQDAEECGKTDQFLPEIEAFLHRGQATGVFLDRGDDRRAAQGLLDYWRAILYRWGHKPPEATLADFDLSLAPKLDDSLCPYRGLEAFREEHRKLFYGRQRLLDELLKKLQESQFRLLAVVGSSGSGKSSVVLGGLIPSLKAGKLPGSENWHYYGSMVPGSNPLENLARLFCPECDNKSGSIEQNTQKFIQNSSYLTELLKHTDNQLSVLVIDQFEEMFTLCLDEVKRQAFISNLLEVIQFPEVSHRIILTMRSDLEDRVAKFSDFDSLFKQGRVQVLSLGANELREAIEKPAESVGLKFEEGLVDKLIQDVVGEDAALPLLQFTLLKLWEKRERNRISMEAYRKLGGCHLALSNSADDFYTHLILEDQVTCKRIFLKMVRPTEGLEVTSSRIPLKELYQSGEAGDRVERVLNKLIEARLVRKSEGNTPNDTQVEVAHEALIRNWLQLVEWLEDERVNLRQRLRLKLAAEQWEEKGRDQGALLRGSLLEEARQYNDLTELETQFIDTSVEQLDRQKEEKRQEKEKEDRRRRDIRNAWAITAVALVAGVVSTGFWWIASKEIDNLNKEIVTRNKEIDNLKVSKRSLDDEIVRKQAKIDELKATIGDLTPTSLTIFTLNDAQQQEAEKIKALFVLRGVDDKVISFQKNTDPRDRPYTTEVRYYNYPADVELAQSILFKLQKDLKIIRSRISLVSIDKRPKGTIDIYLQAP